MQRHHDKCILPKRGNEILRRVTRPRDARSRATHGDRRNAHYAAVPTSSITLRVSSSCVSAVTSRSRIDRCVREWERERGLQQQQWQHRDAWHRKQSAFFPPARRDAVVCCRTSDESYLPSLHGAATVAERRKDVPVSLLMAGEKTSGWTGKSWDVSTFSCRQTCQTDFAVFVCGRNLTWHHERTSLFVVTHVITFATGKKYTTALEAIKARPSSNFGKMWALTQYMTFSSCVVDKAQASL